MKKKINRVLKHRLTWHTCTQHGHHWVAARQASCRLRKVHLALWHTMLLLMNQLHASVALNNTFCSKKLYREIASADRQPNIKRFFGFLSRVTRFYDRQYVLRFRIIRTRNLTNVKQNVSLIFFCCYGDVAVCVSVTLMNCAETTESIIMRPSPGCSAAILVSSYQIWTR